MRVIYRNYVMRVIYTSKGMSKSLGCALAIEQYGSIYGEQVVVFVLNHMQWRWELSL